MHIIDQNEMKYNYSRAIAVIDLDAIAYNIQQIKKRIKNCSKVIAVVKADAYGHGSVEVADTLIENGVDYLAVAIADEAIKLRCSNIKVPILVFGQICAAQMDECLQLDLTQTVFSLEVAKTLSSKAKKLKKVAKIHIKLDTGMGRVGFYPDAKTIEVIKTIHALPNIEIEGLYTHFPSADEEDKQFTIGQIQTFLQFKDELEKMNIFIPMLHVANSACIMDIEDGYLDYVRPGLILYGLYPSEVVRKDLLPLKPVMSIRTQISFVKEMEENRTISYGRTYSTKKKSIIATIPVGYADGYPRLLSSKGSVIIHGQFAPIVGRICMDQFMVDVSDIKKVQAGDEAILMGCENDVMISAEEIASIAGTINYEIVTRIGRRIPLHYYKNKKCVKIINHTLE